MSIKRPGGLLGKLLWRSWALLKTFWAVLGPLGGPVGAYHLKRLISFRGALLIKIPPGVPPAVLEPLGHVLGASWGLRESSWDLLDVSRGLLGTSWGGRMVLGSLLGHLRGLALLSCPSVLWSVLICVVTCGQKRLAHLMIMSSHIDTVMPKQNHSRTSSIYERGLENAAFTTATVQSISRSDGLQIAQADMQAEQGGGQNLHNEAEADTSDKSEREREPDHHGRYGDTAQDVYILGFTCKNFSSCNNTAKQVSRMYWLRVGLCQHLGKPPGTTSWKKPRVL